MLRFWSRNGCCIEAILHHHQILRGFLCISINKITWHALQKLNKNTHLTIQYSWLWACCYHQAILHHHCLVHCSLQIPHCKVNNGVRMISSIAKNSHEKEVCVIVTLLRSTNHIAPPTLAWFPIHCPSLKQSCKYSKSSIKSTHLITLHS